ncbi:MAG TPA: hypothetical protein PKG48_08295 [Bacteroidales bacterium]|nr:hypothetical protein [Bacteroidales bacterium]
MRSLRFLLPLLFLASILISCNKDLDVNAGWKDITIVYGLLDTSADTNHIKITKAFLGDGDALRFAQTPDSSSYPDKLEVRLDEYADTTRVASHLCDTVTVHNKLAGDSIFYFPDQLMYYTLDKLNENRTYKLVIKNKVTGKIVTGETVMVRDFEVFYPLGAISFIPGQTFRIKWTTARYSNAKRYQLVIRFHYLEWHTTNPGEKVLKHVDWKLFDAIKPNDVNLIQTFDLYYPASIFYSYLGGPHGEGGAIKVDPLLTRSAKYVDFIFTAAAPDFSTYLDVNQPSLSLVQEKPAYTNITNGIGLFSSRYTKVVDSLFFGSKVELETNELTKNLNFEH